MYVCIYLPTYLPTYLPILSISLPTYLPILSYPIYLSIYLWINAELKKQMLSRDIAKQSAAKTGTKKD